MTGGAKAAAPALGAARDPRALPGRQAAALAFGSGLLYFLAFPKVDLWPLAFVAFAPMFVAVAYQTPRRALGLGLLTGLGMTVPGFWWLLEMLKTFSGFPTVACAFFVVVLSAYQSGRLALMGWLAARGGARGWPRVTTFALAFVASELFYPLLFPWSFAATVYRAPVFTQLAELGGTLLVGLVLLTPTLALGEAWLARREGRKPDRRTLAFGVVTPALAAIYGLVRLQAIDARVAEAEPVRVGVVQGNMGLMQKRENPAEGLRRHVRLTREAKAAGAELVVWSESSVTFAVPEELAEHGHYMRDRFAAQLGLPAIFGAVLVRDDPDPARRYRFFNTALSTDDRGEVTGRFDKHYLLMFGEYLPLGDAFPILYKWSPNTGKFSPGEHVKSLPVTVRGKAHKVGTLICYEDIIPAFTNQVMNEDEPELLVNITNDAWFGDTAEPHQHLALATFRAVEHRKFLVRSTNSGVSAVVDPVGRIHRATVPFTETQFVETARFLPGKTLYTVVRDVPFWLLAAVSVALAFVRRRVPGGEPVPAAPRPATDDAPRSS